MLSPFVAAALVSKPLVLMIHGAGGGGWEYQVWKPVFERAGYRVIAQDLVPAQGGLEFTTFNDYVGQIERWSNQKPNVIIGASMGGMLALKAAEHLHPRALVLVSSTLPTQVKTGKPGTYPNIVRWANGPYKDTVESMPDTDDSPRRFAWKHWRDESGSVLNAISGGIEAAKPCCPVLSIIPEKDESIAPAHQMLLAKWAHAKVLTYRGMSHVGPLMSRRAANVAKDTLKWLRTTIVSAKGKHPEQS